MKASSSLILVLLLCTQAQGKIVKQDIEYKEGSTVLQGYVAYDDQGPAKKPGVLIVHEWMGLNQYAKNRAEQLAKMGYVAFAVDIFGKGVRPTDAAEAKKQSSTYKGDRKTYRARLVAGLEELKKQKKVNASKIAAIGYCFGGTGALELARAGADIKGAVSFHGNLDTPNIDVAKNIKGKVLVLHGADDPVVPDTEISAFEKEMRSAGVDWQLVKYAKSVHGFTNPDNKPNPERPAVAYNAEADRRSWAVMTDFFNEIFK